MHPSAPLMAGGLRPRNTSNFFRRTPERRRNPRPAPRLPLPGSVQRSCPCPLLSHAPDVCRVCEPAAKRAVVAVRGKTLVEKLALLPAAALVRRRTPDRTRARGSVRAGLPASRFPGVVEEDCDRIKKTRMQP